MLETRKKKGMDMYFKLGKADGWLAILRVIG